MDQPVTPAASGPADAALAWTAATLAQPAAFTRPWSADELAALESIAEEAQASEHPPLDPGDGTAMPAALAPAVAAIRHAVQAGPGFVLTRGLPVARWGVDRSRWVVWTLARALGLPVTQTPTGARLVDVTDTSRTETTPRQFKTSLELRLHTDPCSDMIGLACIHPADEGGDSVLASAVSVHDAMQRTRPDLLTLLYRGFHWHRFGEGRPEDGPVTQQRVPVFARHGDRISCRYVRSPIVGGHREAGVPLEPAEIEALDLLDRLASSPEHRVVFRLAPGDFVIVHNLALLHARTEFRDPAPPAPPRRLFRLWLAGFEGFHPTPPAMNYFNGGLPGMPATGGQAAYDMQAHWRDPASGGKAHLGVR